MDIDFSLVKLFNFIKTNGRDLDPDHYQIAIRPNGLSVRIVLKYIEGTPDKEVEIGKIGL